MSVGSVISGKYEVRKEIKRGGFGIIYEGVDTNFGKTVAIKAIDPDLLGEAKYVDMFQHEALNIARLNHQNIVQVFDIRRGDAGQVYIIMEYIDGFDLLRVLRACRNKGTQMPPHLAAHLASEVCNGLDYAHNRRDLETKEPLKLVHKDISPVNIMLTRSGEVKIIDFGMAGLLNPHKKKFNQVQIQGNIRYLAPEQAKQDELDRRVDIFSLGVVLFEILTGERLVASNNMQQIVEGLILGDFNLSRLETPDIPEKLQQITAKALAANRGNRYPTANDMYRDLMHHLILTAPTANFTSELVDFFDEVDPDSVEGSVSESDDTELSMSPEIETETETGPVAFEPDSGNGTQQPVDEHSLPVEAAPHSDDKPPETETDEPLEASEPVETAGVAPDLDDGNGAPPDDLSSQADSQIESEGWQASEPIAESEPEQEPTAPESPSDYYSFVDESDDDNQKTIIDIVRLSARTHQKSIIIALVTLLVSVLSFTVVDTFANLTPFGTSIYDFLFPPAIKVVSVPSQASVYLDDQLLMATTPLTLNEISPGVHKLMLTLPQYESIVKSINVARKGELHLSGEAARRGSQPYVLKFKNRLDITSQPAGAQIIVDGTRLTQVTPATVFWDVSEEPAKIELELAGLPKLTGLSINSMAGMEAIADRRLWKVDKPIAGKAHYLIEGIFHRSITFNSTPRIADIHYNGSEKPVGVTGISGNMMLPIGDHSFTYRKQGYLPSSFTLSVDENTPAVVHRDLSRTVRIFAKDALSGVDRDLKAKVVSLSLNGKPRVRNKRTPAAVQLLPYSYTALVRKKGYHDLTINISPKDKSIVAKMQPLYHEITVEAIDAITSAPVSTAKISYNPENIAGSPETLGITNQNGKLTGKLAPGTYEVMISKEGYQVQRKSIVLRSNTMNRLTFRLTALR